MITALVRDLEGVVPLITEPARVRRKSRDFFWYSPVLNEELRGLAGDVLVEARDEADVVAAAAACAQHRVPLTVRGAGTGNYGQAVPLAGGVVLDVTGLDAVEWLSDRAVRCGPGIRMGRLDEALRPAGLELRMHPSTKRTATIGGFVAGGSGGVGSITWGGLREPGNVLVARVVTVEAEPRVIELRGADTGRVNRTYGTTGIITALEMPVAPARRWIDLVVAFDSFDAAWRCGFAAASDERVTNKLLTPIAWPIPRWFGPLGDACPPGASLLLGMIDAPSLPVFRDLVLNHGGQITLARPTGEASGETPIYEYTWNHTTLQALKTDRAVTYLQCLYPADRILQSAAKMSELFGEELFHHMEFIRFDGRLTCSGLPILRYRGKDRLQAIIDAHEAHGIFVANPHVVTLEDGSRHKRVEADQLGFKHEVDPLGLLNPGKMRTYRPAARETSPC